MKIDYILLKQISILSGFFGLIIGFITIIPFVGGLSLTFLLCFFAPLIIWLLVKYNCLSLSSMQDGIITGAISGFVGYMAFSIIYIPISIILLKLFGFSANPGVGVILNNGNFFILTVLSVFMGVLSATINAFTGFLTFYVLDIIEKFK